MQHKTLYNKIREDITCPITGQIMTRPIILLASGHTYEEDAIVEHLKRKLTDPATNQAITDPPLHQIF